MRICCVPPPAAPRSPAADRAGQGASAHSVASSRRIRPAADTHLACAACMLKMTACVEMHPATAGTRAESVPRPAPATTAFRTTAAPLSGGVHYGVAPSGCGRGTYNVYNEVHQCPDSTGYPVNAHLLPAAASRSPLASGGQGRTGSLGQQRGIQPANPPSTGHTPCMCCMHAQNDSMYQNASSHGRHAGRVCSKASTPLRGASRTRAATLSGGVLCGVAPSGWGRGTHSV